MQSLKSEHGQTLVEFALVLPILLVLVIGIFDFGSAFNHKNDLNFLANTAARYAEVNSCNACSGQKIDVYVAGTADFSPKPTIQICYPNNGSSKVGDPLRVIATAPFNWLAANLPGLPQTPTTLKSTVEVRILQDINGTPDYTVTTPCPS